MTLARNTARASSMSSGLCVVPRRRWNHLHNRLVVPANRSHRKSAIDLLPAPSSARSQPAFQMATRGGSRMVEKSQSNTCGPVVESRQNRTVQSGRDEVMFRKRTYSLSTSVRTLPFKHVSPTPKTAPRLRRRCGGWRRQWPPRPASTAGDRIEKPLARDHGVCRVTAADAEQDMPGRLSADRA